MARSLDALAAREQIDALVAPEAGVLGASVVGTQIPIATGWALAAKMRATGQVVACFWRRGDRRRPYWRRP